jgi:hypothetical protein
MIQLLSQDEHFTLGVHLNDLIHAVVYFCIPSIDSRITPEAINQHCN